MLPLESAKHKNFDEYLDSCIKSIKDQNKSCERFGDLVGEVELNIVHSREELLIEKLKNYDFGEVEVNLLVNEGDTDFSSQVNLGVKSSKYDWVSIIEFDDEYSSIWFKNVGRYVNSYPDVSAFLPLVIDVDNKGVFAGFTNEATFAANMNSEIGILTNEVLLNYQNFQSSGMVFKKSLFEDFGGFKKSIKLTFVYELLLRLTYNSVKIMTIPRIGYKHMNMREGSIFWNYKNSEESLKEDEVSFWIDSAKKEQFFNYDRDIKYEPNNV